MENCKIMQFPSNINFVTDSHRFAFKFPLATFIFLDKFGEKPKTIESVVWVGGSGNENLDTVLTSTM